MSSATSAPRCGLVCSGLGYARYGKQPSQGFYDLWLIAQTFEFRQSILVDAVGRTFERRGTMLPADTPVGLTDEFAAARAAQWRTFLADERMAAAPDSFTTVTADLDRFLIPLLGGSNADLVWPTGGPWSLEAPEDE